MGDLREQVNDIERRVRELEGKPREKCDHVEVAKEEKPAQEKKPAAKK